MSTAILPAHTLEAPPPAAVLPPTPEEIDTSIAQYEAAKRHYDVARIALDEEKGRLVFLADSFGAVPDGAPQSRRMEGRLNTATVTRGTSVGVDDSRVLDLHFFLTQTGISDVFEKLFSATTKHKLVKGATGFLRTVALPERKHQKLMALFGQCIQVETNAPSVKVELRQPEKPARKTAKKGGR